MTMLFDGMTAQQQARLGAQFVCTDHSWSWHAAEFSTVQDSKASVGWKLSVLSRWSWNTSSYIGGLCTEMFSTLRSLL